MQLVQLYRRGFSRHGSLEIPPNVRTIRVMCSGRVDPGFILQALTSGADGVLVCGCHPGDCHYVEGNYKCLRRMLLTKRLLQEMGINPRRLRLEWVSASEGERYREVVTSFTEEIRALGPFKPQDWAYIPDNGHPKAAAHETATAS